METLSLTTIFLVYCQVVLESGRERLGVSRGLQQLLASVLILHQKLAWNINILEHLEHKGTSVFDV